MFRVKLCDSSRGKYALLTSKNRFFLYKYVCFSSTKRILLQVKLCVSTSRYYVYTPGKNSFTVKIICFHYCNGKHVSITGKIFFQGKNVYFH